MHDLLCELSDCVMHKLMKGLYDCVVHNLMWDLFRLCGVQIDMSLIPTVIPFVCGLSCSVGAQVDMYVV